MIEKMIRDRQGRYPADLRTFASSDESFSESQNVDATYLGRRVEEIDVATVLGCQDTAFMAERPLAYFWPRILQAIEAAPGSQFTRYMIVLVFARWAENRSESGFDFLSRSDWEATLSTLQTTDFSGLKSRDAGKLQAMIDWIKAHLDLQ